MRRLTFHIAVFLLPIVAGVYILPANEARVFNGLENDCAGRGQWIYHRLYESDQPVDLAFLGSSKTIHSVNPMILEESTGLNVANLGYCRYGRNLQYNFLKRLIQQKEPRFVVVEVRYSENPYSHPIFPYVASVSDLLTAYPFYNKDWFTDELTAFQYRLQMAQEDLFSDYQNSTTGPPDTSEHSFQPLIGDAGKSDLQLMREKRQKGDDRTAWKRDFDNTFPHAYLKRMWRLCEKHGVKLLFLYLPNYGVPAGKPLSWEQYAKYGALMIPPDSILDKPENWADPNHLNHRGTSAMTQWLKAELPDLLE